MRWVKDEAHRLGCEAVHLDSGVNLDRAPAHRLYMRHRMAITAHHFSVEVEARPDGAGRRPLATS